MLPPDCENTEKKSNATQDNAAVVYTSVADVAKLTAGQIMIALTLFNAFSDRSKHGKATILPPTCSAAWKTPVAAP